METGSISRRISSKSALTRGRSLLVFDVELVLDDEIQKLERIDEQVIAQRLLHFDDFGNFPRQQSDDRARLHRIVFVVDPDRAFSGKDVEETAVFVQQRPGRCAVRLHFEIGRNALAGRRAVKLLNLHALLPIGTAWLFPGSHLSSPFLHAGGAAGAFSVPKGCGATPGSRCRSNLPDLLSPSPAT